MNNATDGSKVGVQILITNPVIYNTTNTNYISILEEINQTFNTQLNCVRAKWKDIQKTDEITREIGHKVDQVTSNAEEIAHNLQATRKMVKHNELAVNELNTEVVSLREDVNDVTSSSQWKLCEEDYLNTQECVERDRIVALQDERDKLERETSIIKSRFINAFADLCEGDEKLRHLQLFSEGCDEAYQKEKEQWQHSVKTCHEDRQEWVNQYDVIKRIESVKPLQDELNFLKSNVLKLRKQVAMEKSKRASETGEYRHIQHQCLEAVDRIQELKQLVASYNHHSSEQSADNSGNPIAIEGIILHEV